jgi:transcriptional regulator with XRE-family HTH domain
VTSSFGKALRAARKQRDLSQEQFADASGLDQTVISMYERGETTPGHNHLGSLSRGLAVSLPEMVEWYVPASASRWGHDDRTGRR